MLALWLFVSAFLAILFALLGALGLGTFFATGVATDWLDKRGPTFFDGGSS